MHHDDLLETTLHSPLRARRRQSDAKWRASVATCYDALRYVVPDTKCLSRKKVSKALILEESEKHIHDLENTIDQLVKAKCASEDKAMLWKEDNCWTRCSLDTFRQDFANQQHKIFHRSYQSRRCYSLLRDIQEEVFSLTPDPGSICLIDEKALPCANEPDESIGPQISVLQRTLPSSSSCWPEVGRDVSLLVESKDQDVGNGKGPSKRLADDYQQMARGCLQSVESFRVVDNCSVLDAWDNVEIADQIVPDNEATSLGEDKKRHPGSFTVLDKVPPSSSSSPASCCHPTSGLYPPIIASDGPAGKETPQTVPSSSSSSYFFEPDFADDSSLVSFWSNPEEDCGARTTRDDARADHDGCLKVESVRPVIHIPFLDDQRPSLPGNGLEGDKTCNPTVKEELFNAESIETKETPILTLRATDIWKTGDSAKSERTPSIHLNGDTGPASLTDGFKRKVSTRNQEDGARATPKCRKRLEMMYGSQCKSECPGPGLPSAWCDDVDGNVHTVPVAEGRATTTSNSTSQATRKAESLAMDPLLSSELVWNQEVPADFDGFSYYYRQVSQKISPSQNASCPEMAAKIAHVWTRLSDQDKQTMRMLATIEAQAWESPSRRCLGDLSQDLQEVDVKPLDVRDWSTNHAPR